MRYLQRVAVPDREQKLELLCQKAGDAWRIHIWPTWLPEHLARCFDDECEAYPVYLDLHELDRQMRLQQAEYKITEAKDGSLQLEATGPSVAIMMKWLSRSFESGTEATLGSS